MATNRTSSRSDDTETGFIVRRQEDKESNVERMEFVACNNAHARVGVYIPPGGGPGGFLRIIATVVPIDENSSQFNAWRMRKLGRLAGRHVPLHVQQHVRAR